MELQFLRLFPVFPEERLLLEILLEKEPNTYADKSVWAVNSRYYINGKGVSISSKVFQNADTDAIAEKIEKHKSEITYQDFNSYIQKFIDANRGRLTALKSEASEFVRNTAEQFKEEQIVLSFSGGKDSTATADIVVKALSNPSLVHIFGNTTLEFPYTVEYAEQYRREHPHAIFLTAKNEDQVFMDVCEDIGPPARMMRWCCSI